MTSNRSPRGTLAFLFATGVILAPAGAWAASTCAQSSDCPKGFSCQVEEVATPCPAIACAPGETCTQPQCDPQAVSSCTPLPCTADSDCASGMVCFAQTTDNCAGTTVAEPACPPNEKCAEPAPTPETCTSTTTRSCVPRYLLPCTTASDCGDGFTCAPDEVGSCSGGGSVPSEDGGPVPPPPPPVCTTTTLSTSHCSANTVVCSSASDCPSGWTCEVAPQAISNIACAVPASIDGGPVASDCDPGPLQPTQMQCAPPYADLGSSGAFGETRSAGLGSSATAPETPTEPSAGAAKSTTDQGGGCSAAPGPARGGVLWLLGLIGLVGVTRRRAAH
jgi:MYXO-CTERM domain-containing protein